MLCLDEFSERVARRLEAVEAVPVARLEADDPTLPAAREDRSFKEYAWTLKPAFCLHRLDRVPRADAVVFLDADVMLFGSLEPLLHELETSSVVLVPERHQPPPAWSEAGTRR